MNPNRRQPPNRYRLWQQLTARLLLLSFATALMSGSAQANGERYSTEALGDGTVTAGDVDVTVDTAVHTEITQNTDFAALAHDRDIHQPAGHLLHFVQGANDTIVVRPGGAGASEFFGTTVCDATCIWADAQGLIWHDGSQVDASLFMAVAGEISNESILWGTYDITTTPQSESAGVVNNGVIMANDVALIGSRVANFGHIAVDDGALLMVAGDRVVMRDFDSPVVINAELVPEGSDPARTDFDGDPVVQNSGGLHAGSGSARLAAGDMLSLAIRNSGTIRARRIALEAGNGAAVEVSGVLDASHTGYQDAGIDVPGGEGGRIDVLGDFVAVGDGALLDASGSTGGGTIRVGGDVSGAEGTRAARRTLVDETATLRADATREGDGGDVIVWSDEVTRMHGTIQARGGVEGGDGGFAETSGKLYLDLAGPAPDLRSRSGDPDDRGGHWLIDPINIEIRASCDGVSDEQCIDTAIGERELPINIALGDLKPAVDDSVITAETIAKALSDGVDVTLTTQTAQSVVDDPDNPNGNQVGNITLTSGGGIAILAGEDVVSGPTFSNLSLLAAGDIVLDDTIDNQNENLVLNVSLVANDPGQPEQDVSDPNALDPSFSGGVIVNAAINTGGGAFSASGGQASSADAAVRIDGDIRTDGGSIEMFGIGGHVEINGAIDTSTDRTDPLSGTRVRGGGIEIISEARYRPDDRTDAPTYTLVGGDVDLAGEITTGGGFIRAVAAGGDATVAADVDTSISDGQVGGFISLRAEEQTFAPGEGSPSPNITRGGTITHASGTLIETGGADVALGLEDSTGLTLGASTIRLEGRIDTRIKDGAEGDGFDDARAGGSVFMQTRQVGATGVFLTDAEITTNGGSFEANRTLTTDVDVIVPLPDRSSGGVFHMTNSTIDTSTSDELDETEQAFASVLIAHLDGVRIDGQATGQSEALRADNVIRIEAGASGSGDLELGTQQATTFRSNEFLLSAGDRHTPSEPTRQGARVVFGGTGTEPTFANFDDSSSNPQQVSSFTVLQDADLSTSADSSVQAANFALAAPIETLTLESSDGTLTVNEQTDIDGLVGTESELTLVGGQNVVLGEALVSGSGQLVDTLTLATANDFTVDMDLATKIDGSADEIRIQAGALENSTSGDLTVEDDLSAGVNGDGKLFLQAGFSSAGDLSIASGSALAADRIVLRAGNGFSGDGSRVRVSEGATFEGVTDFTLRQNAAIDDDTIPMQSQFTAAGGGTRTVFTDLEYTLRSDVGSISIEEKVGELAQTQLVLHALTNLDSNGIDFLFAPSSPLVVSTLEMGGLNDFRYTQAMADRILWLDDATSALTLRAGIGSNGLSGAQLAFDSGVVVEADIIHLAAGDGLGGRVGSTSASIFFGGSEAAPPIFRSASGGAIDTFVFQQDREITQSDLPTLSQFGGDRPMSYGVRSDYAPDENEDALFAIRFDDFADGASDLAQSRLVLSGASVSLDRGDGENLVLTGLGTTGANGELELRANQLVLTASTQLDDGGVPIGPRPVVDATPAPESNPALVQVRGYEAADALEDALEEDRDFAVAPILDIVADSVDSSPAAITILQDGDIVVADLLDPATQLWNSTDPECVDGQAGDCGGLFFYDLISRQGNVTIDPAKTGTGQLELATVRVDAQDGVIEFDGPSFEFASFNGSTGGDWTVGADRGGVVSDLSLTSRFGTTLSAGRSGVGDLRFADSLELQQQELVLTAGDTSDARPLGSDEAIRNAAQVIFEADATQGTGTPLMLFKVADEGYDFGTDEDDVTGLQIIQDASMSSAVFDGRTGTVIPTDDGDPAEYGPVSILPDWTRVVKLDSGDPPTQTNAPIAAVSLTSRLGNVTLDGTDELAATTRNLALLAGELLPSTDQYEGVARVGYTGDSSDRSIDLRGFDRFITFSDALELVARGTGNTVVAEERGGADPSFFAFFAANSPDALTRSPSRFLFQQDDAISEQAPASPPPGFDSCADDGCLPNANTFGGGLASAGIASVDYTVRSTGGSVYVDRTVADKVWGSNLTLEASDQAGADVTFDLGTAGELSIADLALQSLRVQEVGVDAADSSLQIRFEGSDGTGRTNCPPPCLFVQNASEYYGDVIVANQSTLLGSEIEFAGTVTNDGNGAGLIFGVSRNLIFNEDVDLGQGTGDDASLLQVYFVEDLSGSPSVLPGRIRLTSDAQEQTLTASQISILPGLDFDDPFNQVPRQLARPSVIREPGEDVPGDLTLDANVFEMGEGEKMTVLGTLQINAVERAALSDLSALDIVVDAPLIQLVRRAAGTYLRDDGQLADDAGVDYVANTIEFTNASASPDIESVGSGRRPIFGIANPLAADPDLDGFPLYAATNDHRTLRDTDLVDGFGALDLHPEGASRDDFTNMLVDPLIIPEPRRPFIPDPWLIPDTAPMAELDIAVRPSRTSERLSRLRGATIIDDVGSDLLMDGETQILVSEARLSTLHAETALELYQGVFGEEGELSERTRRVLQRALDQYRNSRGTDRVVGFELRQFVKNRPNTQFDAYRILENLDTLFAYHRRLGLTPGEYRPIQHKWLEQIKPDGISLTELSEAVHPSRYVRGSDVLDIFGE